MCHPTRHYPTWSPHHARAARRYPALSATLRGEGREEVARLGWDRPAGLVNDVYREVVGAPA